MFTSSISQRHVILGPRRLQISTLYASLSSRRYLSTLHQEQPPFPPAQSAVLSAALCHVPTHGFTQSALLYGARDAGYLDVSVNLFPRGAFEIVHYHLICQRLALKRIDINSLIEANSVSARVKALTLQRLEFNKDIIHRWQEAIALMALQSNVRSSLTELARLSGDIWYLAGDTSVDFSWYTKRATLSAIYSSTELFMTTDCSSDFLETRDFLDRRLGEVEDASRVIGSLKEWAILMGQSASNIARSKSLIK